MDEYDIRDDLRRWNRCKELNLVEFVEREADYSYLDSYTWNDKRIVIRSEGTKSGDRCNVFGYIDFYRDGG